MLRPAIPPSAATTAARRPLAPRVGSAPFALLVGILVAGIVSASAASIGPVRAAMTSDVAVVTYDESVRRASGVAAEVGSKSLVTAATVTITGPELANLTGQVATLVLLDSSGAQVASSTAVLDSSASLVIGASVATFRLGFASPPSRARADRWAVIVVGESVLGPSFDTPARTVTTGQGTVTFVRR